METIEEQARSECRGSPNSSDEALPPSPDNIEIVQTGDRICLVGNLMNDCEILRVAHSFNMHVVNSETGESVLEDDEYWSTRYIIKDFDGPEYERVNAAKKCILGPPALKWVSHRNLKLPYTSRAVYSFAMRGVVACFTGLRNKEELTAMVMMIHSMGGAIRKDMNSRITHLIANHSTGDKYQYAKTFRLPVLRTDWVAAAWAKREDPTFSAVDESFASQYRLHIFAGQRICLSGFSDEEYQEMRAIMLANGGTPVALDDPTCTHVVLPCPIPNLFTIMNVNNANNNDNDNNEHHDGQQAANDEVQKKTETESEMDCSDAKMSTEAATTTAAANESVARTATPKAEDPEECDLFDERLVMDFTNRRPGLGSMRCSSPYLAQELYDEEAEDDEEEEEEEQEEDDDEENADANINTAKPKQIKKEYTSTPKTSRHSILKNTSATYSPIGFMGTPKKGGLLAAAVIGGRYRRRSSLIRKAKQVMAAKNEAAVAKQPAILPKTQLAQKPRSTKSDSDDNEDNVKDKGDHSDKVNENENDNENDAAADADDNNDNDNDVDMMDAADPDMSTTHYEHRYYEQKPTAVSLKEQKKLRKHIKKSNSTIHKVKKILIGRRQKSSRVAVIKAAAAEAIATTVTSAMHCIGNISATPSRAILDITRRSMSCPPPKTAAAAIAAPAIPLKPPVGSDKVDSSQIINVPVVSSVKAEPVKAENFKVEREKPASTPTPTSPSPVVYTAAAKKEPANPQSIIVTAEWFWYTIQNGYADTSDFLMGDKIVEAHQQMTPNTDRRESLPISFNNKRKRKRFSQRLQLEGTPLSTGKRRSSVSDAGLLSVSSSFFDFTSSPDKLENTSHMSSDHKSSKSDQTPGKKASMRHNHFMDFYSTESNYVGILDTIVQLFKNPLEKMLDEGDPLLNKAEIHAIFSNFQPIYDVHLQMLQALREIHHSWTDTCLIGDIILEHQADLTRAYPKYVNCFEQMQETLQHCDSAYPRFHAFLKINQTKPECGRQTLQDLMIRPVQRLPSISLLLTDILKYTSKSNPDHARLTEALKSLKEVTTYINEDKRKTDARVAMFDVFNGIDGCPPELISSNRDFVAKIDIIEMTDMMSGRGDSLVLYLFSDYIEFCKKRTRVFNTAKSPSTGKVCKHLQLMSLNSILHVVDITDGARAFALVTKDCTYAYSIVDDDATKAHYVSLLCKQIAQNACVTDIDNFYLSRTSQELGVDISDIHMSTLSKAFKLATRTRLKVGRAFSFSKTPSKLKRTTSTMMTPPFGSNNTVIMTPASQLAQMQLASCNNVNETDDEQNTRNSSTDSESQVLPLKAPLSEQPKRKNKSATIGRI